MRSLPQYSGESAPRLLRLIAVRAVILLAVLNIAEPMGILPRRIGALTFLPFFNILAIILTSIYLALWWSKRHLALQLYFQVAMDLCLTTLLVVETRGIESPFVSFYLLIITYCSLTLGRNGGMIGAAMSAILYAGVIMAGHLGLTSGGLPVELKQLTFRVSAHALGFFAVAFLGVHLSQHLHVVQQELEEKIDSLRKLQKLNEHIITSIRSGLITTDLQGAITVFNDAAAEITEKEEADVLAKPVGSILGRQLWAKIIKVDLLKDARPLRHEDWVVLPSGARRYLGSSVSPLQDEGRRLIGYIISFQDLTDIKRLEEEVRVKERMAAVGRMAAGIAHEIRNPLAALRGSVEILRSRAGLPKNDERLLDILIRESDRLDKFVGDFLHFARPGQHPLGSVDLVSLLRDSVLLLQNSPEVRARHSIVLNLDTDRIGILGNPDQLKQVFWNLSQNSLRAMPGGGVLTIAARKAECGGGQITFHDVGIGMTAQEKEQLFQPFHSGFNGGAGLGLSIVFQIVEDHRGKITFDSEKGRGTTVTLFFPGEFHHGRTIH